MLPPSSRPALLSSLLNSASLHRPSTASCERETSPQSVQPAAMSLSRPASTSLRSALIRSRTPARTHARHAVQRLAGRRGYASGPSMENIKGLSSEMPWIIGAAAVTLPSIYFILSSGPLTNDFSEEGYQGGEDGKYAHHEEHHEEEEEGGGEEAGEGGEEQAEAQTEEGGEASEGGEAKAEGSEGGEAKAEGGEGEQASSESKEGEAKSSEAQDGGEEGAEKQEGEQKQSSESKE